MAKSRRRDYEDDDWEHNQGDETGGIIPYKNTAALIAYYLGVFSLIPCLGIPLGITAFVLGIVGIRNYSENPRVSGVVHAWIGIILGGGLALLNLALLGFMVALPFLSGR